MADISKINPNGTEYNLKDAAARDGIESSKTLKSSVVTVTDAAPNNAEDITVDITPIQDLHGYDRPWVGGAWKNKLPMTVAGIKAANTAGTWSGNTYTIGTGTFTVLTDSADNVLGITINKTSGSAITFNFFNNLSVPYSGSFKFIHTNGFSGGIAAYTYNFSDGTQIDVTNTDIEASVSANLTHGHIYMWNTSVFNNVTVYPMIILATETDATFAPYSNICPIEGRTGAELDRVGKNWAVLDTSHIQSINGQHNDSETYTDSGVTVTSTGSYGRCGFEFKVIQGETYTVSMKAKKSASVGGGGVLLGSTPNWDYEYIKFDNNQITTDFTILNQAITAETDTLYIGIYPVTSGVSVTVENLQVELGSTATSYEPYQGQQYTASFGETVYGGKWHVTEGGTDKIYGRIEFDGSNDEDWLLHQQNPNEVSYQITVYEAKKGGFLSTNYLRSLTLPELETEIGFLNYSDRKFRTYFPTSFGILDVATWRAYLAQHPLQVYYELATPTTISTPKQNVPMLQGINTVYADCGDVSLKYQPDNVVGELKGEIEDNIVYEDYKWTTESSRTYSAGTPGTYGCSSWRDVKKEGYDVIGVTFVENRRFGDCILTLYYIPSTSHVEVIIFRATSSAVTIADEDITYRVAYKKH